MNIIYILDSIGISWCGDGGVAPLLHMIKILINVIHLVVPIGLIVMTTLDIMKKVINPDDKDGQKKIMIRAIAALIVFLTPTIVKFTLNIIDANSSNSELSSCWDRA